MMAEVLARVRMIDVNSKALELFGVRDLEEYRKSMVHSWASVDPVELTRIASIPGFRPAGYMQRILYRETVCIRHRT